MKRRLFQFVNAHGQITIHAGCTEITGSFMVTNKGRIKKLYSNLYESYISRANLGFVQ